MGVKGRAYGLPGGTSSALSEHEDTPDAHHNWPLLDSDVPSTLARDSEVTSAISAHVDASNPKHITVSASAPGSPAVNDLWLDIS
jgi:hypothetical protein